MGIYALWRWEMGWKGQAVSSLAVWLDTSGRPLSWPLTPANAPHAKCFLNTHDQPVGLTSASLSCSHIEMFCSMALSPAISGHSILFCSLHTGLPSWAAGMLRCPSRGGRPQRLVMADELSSYLPWDSGLPGEEEVALKSSLVSSSMSSCFSLSSSDENCQGEIS